MTKYIIAFLLVIGTSATVIAQSPPYINSINPTSAGVGQVVNITGNNLAGASVYFGGTEASAVDLSNAASGLIAATVPFGATYDQISVRTANGIGYSPQKFNLTFDGQAISDASTVLDKVSSQFIFQTNKTQTQDLCVCDFNQDGLLDVAVSNAGSTDGVMTFQNSTTNVGTPVFGTGVVVESGLATTNVICGDINGDGFPDLVANQLGNEGSVYTYLNDGTGSFETGEEWIIPSNSNGDFRKPGRLAIADLDLDGKPEIIAAVEDENIVYFFQNTSTSVDINFVDTPTALSATENSGSAGLGGLDVADMNNDGFPEIIVSNFTESGFYIFQNNSQSSTFNFDTPLFVPTQTSIRTLKTGDLKNNGLLDVIITNSDVSSNNVIEIAENTTTSAGIAMSTTITLTGIRQSWGLDLGDIDGDGDLDIVIGSEIENGFYVITNNNTSSIATSSYSVGLVAESNQDNARNIAMADIDNDGRPDYIYTNRSTSSATGNIGIRLNEVCYVPVIQPSGPTILCTGDVVDLVAPATGYDYVWEKDGVVDAAQTTNTFSNIGTAGVYTVTISDNSGCEIESAEITITTPSDAFAAPTMTVSNSSPCAGVDVTLTATPGGTTSEYLWTGPNGYEETTTAPTIDILGITADHSGEYYVTATSSSSGCQKSSAVETITVTSLPVVTVQNAQPNYFCETYSLNLSATDFGSSYTYDWKLDDVSLGVDTPALLEATTAGDYSISISDGTCTETSEPLTLMTIAAPTSSFTVSDTIICIDVAVDFSATSTGASGIDIVNVWDFAGEATDSGNSVAHGFANTGDRVVTLTAKYDGIADTDCSYTPITETIEVRAVPTDTDLIISDNEDINSFEKCAESDLRIRVDGLFDTYNWIIEGVSVGTNAVLDVGDESSVTVELTDSIQCTFTTAPPVNITNYTNGGIEIVTAGGNTPTDEIEVTENRSTISLEVLNASSPAWEPAIFIDDSTALSVEAAVKNQRVIKVYGIDLLGCQEVDSVTLRVPGVRADKNFTPNGDGIGDCWNVSNVGGSDCQVVIFDSKGRRIRDLSFNPDAGDCVWEGDKSNGSPLPDGVYYYFLSCSDSENESSGSIFMAR